jgi:hypothetical protein
MKRHLPVAAGSDLSGPVELNPLSRQTLVRSVTTHTDVSDGVRCTRIVFRDIDDAVIAAVDVPAPLLPRMIERLLFAIKMRPAWPEETRR